MKMCCRVLERAEDRRSKHVARNAHDEQLSEPGVEDELRRTRLSLQPRIVA